MYSKITDGVNILDYIKSPLNYTGNKYRILSQITKEFPSNINIMVDLFCGGATVGLNVDCKEVYFVDSNERVINLLKFLSEQNFEKLMSLFENEITNYHLSFSYKYGYSTYRKQCSNIKDNNGLKDYNSVGFYAMRERYNSLSDKNSIEGNTLLYLLMLYGFNNDIRFNKKGEFNLPVGKTDLNKLNVEKIKNYIKRCNSIKAHFLCGSFEDENIKKLVKSADFIYMDPPYLITSAVYNTDWNNCSEEKLLSFISELNENHIPFALSNVIKKVDRRNEQLFLWCEKNKKNIKITNINYHYRSSSYHKTNRNSNEEEILVTGGLSNGKN